jgi:integral membrane protein (TIGR01906 family)
LTKRRWRTYDEITQHIRARRRKEEAILGLFRVLTIVLFIAAIPIALIATNIRVAISEQGVYDYSVREYNTAEVSGIPESELLRANGEVKDYLTHGDAGELAIRVRDGRGAIVPLFSARETAHMVDVRELVQTLFALQIASVFAVITLAVITIVSWSPRALATAALCGAVLTGGLLGTAGVVAASGFDSAWTEFHVVAFSNDLWQLDPAQDHLIQMYPESFWLEITTLIVAATLMEAALVGGAAGAYLLMSRPQRVPLNAPITPEVVGPAGHSQPKLATPNPRHYFR